MRPALAIWICILCASCSTMGCKTASRRGIVLPIIAIAGVETGHALESQEVALISAAYFKRFVSGCGMPDTPVDQGQFWSVQLWGGIAGSDYGRFLISKDGRQVTLEPPKSGLDTSTRRLLSHNGIPYN